MTAPACNARRNRSGHSCGPSMMCNHCGAAYPWTVECVEGERLHQEITKRRGKAEEAAARKRREELEREWLRAEQRRLARLERAT